MIESPGMPGFFAGLTYPFRGLAFVAKRRELWKYAAGAFALNLVLFTLGFVALYFTMQDLVNAITPRTAPGWLLPILKVILWIVALALSFFLFTIVGNLVAGPFLDAMTERMLGLLGETLPPSRGLASAFGRTVVNQSLKLFMFGAVQVLLLILLVTPIGFVHPPMAGFLTVVFLALEYMDYPLDARRVAVPSRFRFVLGHLRPSLGFGAACLALSLVPFVLYFLLPAAVAGGVLLVRDVEKSSRP